MSKRHQSGVQDVFDGFESTAEQLADWVRRRALWLGIGLVAAIGGIWGGHAWLQASGHREMEAAAALAGARADYMVAMGADPGSFEAPELANLEAGRRIRAEYAERFREVAGTHAGTVSGTLAALEALDLGAEELETDAALARLEELLAGARGSLRAIVLERRAQLQEAAERMPEAAASYEAAAGISAFPLRDFALADAARCYAAAGDADRARALYDRLEAESPEFALPEHHRVLRRELQASATR
jgi:tetratricopeptide (TPR) repeat protein